MLQRMKIKSLIFNTRDVFFDMVDVHTFFLEVSNVQDKRVNLLLFFYFYFCLLPQAKPYPESKVLGIFLKILLFEEFIFRFLASQ